MRELSPRTKELLEEIARRNEELMFIDGSFLHEMNVSSSECSIFPMLGQIIKGFLKLKPSEQMRIQMLGTGMDPQIAQFAFENLRRSELSDEIKNIKL